MPTKNFIRTSKFFYEIVENKDGTLSIYKSSVEDGELFPNNEEYGNGTQMGYKVF